MMREKTVFVHDKLIIWNINSLIINMMLCTHYHIVTYHFSNKNAPNVYASLSATEEQHKMSNLLFYNWSLSVVYSGQLSTTPCIQGIE
jgi:hypothetical protein